VLFQAVKRNRAEQTITRPRAALIKMVLLSQHTDFPEEDSMAQLDTQNQDPAYLCGRLLAVLERIQQAAIPGAGSTITDRFYGTFSSAPASVAGVLLRKSQAHLAKLRKERRGTERALQGKLEEIQALLNDFPRTLTLEQQGLFGLGYYHQRAQDRADAIARKQEKEEAEAAESQA
jgi:CRISPR-associated protein Csd1